MNSYNDQYRQFLRRRGYKVPLETSDVIYRWWIGSFTQPGFAQFWRIWNPFIGFWLLQFYRMLGGDKYRFLAGLATFAFAGFCHDLFTFLLDPEDGIELNLTIAFVFWSLLAQAMSTRRSLKLLK